MPAVTISGIIYQASGARRSQGKYEYTCDAFVKRRGNMVPVTSQIKLYQLALMLKGVKA